MKKIAFILTLTISSCTGVVDNTSTKKKDSVDKKFNIKNEWNQVLWGSTYNMIEIEVDGCRYFILEGYAETLQMTHKANCNNPIHSK